jgi:hypothetical protein
MPGARYCFDTSALIECWTRYYPKDVFPGLWDKLADYAAHYAIVAPDEVRFEIEKKEDGLHEWVKGRPYLFAPLEEDVQRAAAQILGSYPALVKASARRTEADPFVIGLAQVRGIPVVTAERGGSEKTPKIPYVCGALGIRCLSVVDFIRAEGWQFT